MAFTESYCRKNGEKKRRREENTRREKQKRQKIKKTAHRKWVTDGKSVTVVGWLVKRSRRIRSEASHDKRNFFPSMQDAIRRVSRGAHRPSHSFFHVFNLSRRRASSVWATRFTSNECAAILNGLLMEWKKKNKKKKNGVKSRVGQRFGRGGLTVLLLNDESSYTKITVPSERVERAQRVANFNVLYLELKITIEMVSGICYTHFRKFVRKSQSVRTVFGKVTIEKKK